MESLKGKTAIITGGTRGIGKAIAAALVQEGVNVGIIGRNEELLHKTATELSTENAKVVYAAGNVADQVSIVLAINSIKEKLGSIDILVNNAAIAAFGNFTEMPTATWEEIIQTNVLGVYYTTHAVLPDMFAKQSGDIVNISSMAGIRGAAGTSAYSASKFAVLGLSESLMMEVRKQNIRVTALTPSTVATDMAIADLKITDGNPDKVVQPEDMAELVVMQLKLNRRAFVKSSSIWSTNP